MGNAKRWGNAESSYKHGLIQILHLPFKFSIFLTLTIAPEGSYHYSFPLYYGTLNHQ